MSVAENSKSVSVPAKPKAHHWKWLVLLTVIVGTFLSSLNQTIVSLATPHIMDDFGITVSGATWISTAYILANAVLVPVWGKLGDIVGRKKVYILGFSIFILGSILCGVAWSLNSMIVFRIVQAIAGSADYPTAMAIIAVTFRDNKERAQALGIWSATFAAASVFGPLIGGPLIDNFGWRSVFFLNIPVGLIGLVMALIFIKESRDENQVYNFDWWGAVFLGGSLSTLVLVLEKGLDWGWLSLNSIICYAITIIAGFIFIKLEKKAVDPIVDLKFFKNRIFVGAVVNNFVVFMGMMGCMYLLPIFIQSFLGLNATETGLMFMPMVATMMVCSVIGGRLTGKIDDRTVIFISTLISAAGLYLFYSLEARSTVLEIIIPLSVMAGGMGLGMAQRTNLVNTAVPVKEVGVASSVLALARNIAGAFGIAIFGTILSNATTSKVFEISEHSTLNVLTSANYAKFVSLITLDAQISAYRIVFLSAATIVLVGSFTAFLLKSDKQIALEKRNSF